MADKNFVVKNGLETPVLILESNGVISWDAEEEKLIFSNDGGDTFTELGSGGGGADPVFQSIMYR
jgi:hypothetical protein